LNWDIARKHPGDPSAGDSAGWVMVIFAPVAIPVMAIVGIVGGVIIGKFTYRKLKKSRSISSSNEG
jgi:hypothetical protein